MATSKVTLQTIADHLKLSKASVSLVLNHRDTKIPIETRDKILDAARSLGYIRRPTLLRQKDWLNVAMVEPSVDNFPATSFYAEVSSHLKSKMGSYKMRLLHIEEDPIYIEAALQQVDIVLTTNLNTALRMKERKKRSIVIQGNLHPDFTCIHCDDETAGQDMARHALELGHRHAALLFENLNSRCAKSRYRGFSETFVNGGGQIEKNLSVPFESDEYLSTVLKTHLEGNHPPTFLFCFADNLLFRVYRELRLMNLDVPKDISLAGVDDLIWGRLTYPSFSTVNLCEEMFAEKVLDAIQHTMDGKDPYHLKVPGKLVPRETTSKP